MTFEEYKTWIRQIPRPTFSQMEHFIFKVSREHSWHKHLPPERSVPFVFYIDPNAERKVIRRKARGVFNRTTIIEFESIPKASNLRLYGGLNYYILDNNEQWKFSRTSYQKNPILVNDNGLEIPVPTELIEKGIFKMSCYLQTGYLNATDFFCEVDPGITMAEKHVEIINDLKVHLNDLLNNIYE